MNKVKRTVQKWFLRQAIESGFIKINTAKFGERKTSRNGVRERQFAGEVMAGERSIMNVDYLRELRQKQNRRVTSQPPPPHLSGKGVRRIAIAMKRELM